MTNAFSSYGSTLSVGDGGSPTEQFTPIAEVIDITGPGGENGEIEVTHLGSTAKEFIADLIDYGQVTANANFLPGDTQHDQLLADIASRTVRNYEVSWPTSPASTAVFAAYVQSYQPNVATGQQGQASLTLRVTGAVTYA
ncbi:MAG: phage tail tube protein [Pseudomonadota bacterium]